MKTLTIFSVFYALLGCFIMGFSAARETNLTLHICMAPIVAAVTLVVLFEIRHAQRITAFWKSNASL